MEYISFWDIVVIALYFLLIAGASIYVSLNSKHFWVNWKI